MTVNLSNIYYLIDRILASSYRDNLLAIYINKGEFLSDVKNPIVNIHVFDLSDTKFILFKSFINSIVPFFSYKFNLSVDLNDKNIIDILREKETV